MVIAKSEISVRARMLYHKLDDRIKSDRQGDVVVIDVISGEYEIDPDETVAKLRLLERLPDAALWSIPIGRPRHHIAWWHRRPPGQTMSWQQIRAKGDAWYEKIRHEMEACHSGQFIFIDVASGEYEIASDPETAKCRIAARFPDAALWGTKVGIPGNGKKAGAND